MRLFKQHDSVTKPGGRKVTKQSKKWYAEICGKRVPLSRDKTASAVMAADMLRQAERRKNGIIDRFEEHRT